MSDNVSITPGSGAPIAADNVGGNFHQRVKISVGADGVAADASEATPLPVAAYGELIEAIEAMRIAIAALTKTIGFALPNALGQPIMEVRQTTGSNLLVNANQSGTWNIGTVTNQTQIGGFAANDQIPALLHLQADNLRRNITVT